MKKILKFICFYVFSTYSFSVEQNVIPTPYNSAIFNPIYFKTCEKNKKCFNSSNKKMNELLSQEKTNKEEIFKQCETIRFWDLPELKMPDTYILCAKEGYYRQQSELAYYYQSFEKNPEQAVYWANLSLGVVKKANGKQVPHPDTWKAWESLCHAYYYGEGVEKDYAKAKQYCIGAAYGDSNNSKFVVSKYAKEIIDSIDNMEKQKEKHLYDTLEEMEFLHQLERARNNWK